MRLDDRLALVAILHRHDRLRCGGAGILVIGIANNNDRADTMVDTIITDTPELAVVAAAHGAEAAAPHDDGAEAEPLHLQTQPLLHVVILHDVDLERNLRLAQGLREIRGLRRRERVEVILQLPLAVVVVAVDGVDGLLIGVRVGIDGQIDGAPIGAEEDVCRADVEEDHGIPRTDVVLHGPAHRVGALVGEVHGDADFAARARGGGRGGRRGGVARGGGMVDFDLRELRVGIQCVSEKYVRDCVKGGTGFSFSYWKGKELCTNK
ncbi:hypothetical protein CR513_39626, partial [Mucuna pruriens]